MIKKVLVPSIITAVGIAAFSGAFFSDNEEAIYKERIAQNSEQFPHSMAWAKIDLETGEFNPAAIARERKAATQNASRNTLGLNFENIGPDNIGGRTRAIIEIYGEPNKLITGGVTGGLFRSDNGGATWYPIADLQNIETGSAHISSIHQDTNTGVIYVGTGNSFDDSFGPFPGYGIFVSEDGGESFQHLESTTPFNAPISSSDAGWGSVNRIATDDKGNIYAATGSGLRVSSDGGETWIEDLLPFAGQCADVSITTGNRTLVSYSNGHVFLSQNGLETDFVHLNDKGLPTGGIRRTCVTTTPNFPDILYVMYVNSSDCFHSIYKSEDGGDTWNRLLEQNGEFDPMSNSQFCQGHYDATILVSPEDPNTIYIGGVQIWRYDGNLTRVATQFGSPPVQDLLPNYVHADVHHSYASPNDPNRIYLTTDGGVTHTTNRGQTWQGLNKGYVTTQFYDISAGPENNIVMGGTQDNGTPVLLGENPNDMRAAFSVSGGDGFDTEISQFSGFYFATVQFGVISRGEEGLPSSIVNPGGEVGGPGEFFTSIELWEKENDLSSKDSITFTVEPFLQSIATGNGIIRNYSETVFPVQPESNVDEASLEIKTGQQVLTIGTDGETLEGDGTGSVTFNTDGSFTIEVTFDEAPAENANVDVKYEVSFDANSILYIESENLRSNSVVKVIEHRLESALKIGDQIKIQDPAQSMLATDALGGLAIFRNVLNASESLEGTGIEIDGFGNGIHALTFSPDGNHLFVGTRGGQVTRIDNLQELYTEDDVDKLEDISVGSFSGGVGGIALDPNDPNRGIITAMGFGGGVKVSYSTNMLSNNPTFTDITGDLPRIPIYDAEFNVNDPNMVILGTEFGVYASADITEAGGPTWSNESEETGFVPVYTIEQQQLPWDEAKNSGRTFVGTYGRGIWVTTDLVGINEISHINLDKDAISSLNVFPNPMNTIGRVEFDAAENGNLDFNIYDLSGRHIRNWNERVSEGTNLINFETSDLRSGNYFMTIGNGNNVKTAKFMVLH